jgi:hypothetical protein
MKAYDLPIHRQSVINTLLDNGKDSLDGRSIVHLLRFKAFNFLRQSWRVTVLHPSVHRFLQLVDTAFN